MSQPTFRTLVVVCLAMFTARASYAQDKPPIAATVQGHAILVSQLERDLARVIKERKISEAERTQLQKQVLQLAVDRQLVLHYLATSKQGASSQDVDLVIARLQKKLDNEGVKQAEFLKQQGQTLAEFRDQQLWELSWQKYLDKYLTEAALQKYFDKNRRDFDGTELHVAHLLLTAPADATAADREKLKTRAAAIRQEIVDKKVSFADAAKKNSQSPTAAAGGDIGWISRREPMPESFSAAAFALPVHDISQPVESSFGVHLITTLEEKPGKRTWQEAADELRPAVIRYLFRWIADKERPTAKIEYTEHWPH
ncbi:peptidylprolyl isomerase [Anatilimnocola floriformis]|uniref:peptidylprolyl isomerase n=1 Tax=Anatilimnocola floriformis TaxID=2948575 RepID=UPI0020C30C9D|nr:peptidylprolyl isomerase [Anatilimnocola floriformis]